MCGINAVGAQGCSCMSTFCHSPLKIALLLHKMANGPYSLSETVYVENSCFNRQWHSKTNMDVGLFLTHMKVINKKKRRTQIYPGPGIKGLFLFLCPFFRPGRSKIGPIPKFIVFCEKVLQLIIIGKNVMKDSIQTIEKYRFFIFVPQISWLKATLNSCFSHWYEKNDII